MDKMGEAPLSAKEQGKKCFSCAFFFFFFKLNVMDIHVHCNFGVQNGSIL